QDTPPLSLRIRPPPRPSLLPYTTLFRSSDLDPAGGEGPAERIHLGPQLPEGGFCPVTGIDEGNPVQVLGREGAEEGFIDRNVGDFDVGVWAREHRCSP